MIENARVIVPEFNPVKIMSSWPNLQIERLFFENIEKETMDGLDTQIGEPNPWREFSGSNISEYLWSTFQRLQEEKKVQYVSIHRCLFLILFNTGLFRGLDNSALFCVIDPQTWKVHFLSQGGIVRYIGGVVFQQGCEVYNKLVVSTISKYGWPISCSFFEGCIHMEAQVYCKHVEVSAENLRMESKNIIVDVDGLCARAVSNCGKSFSRALPCFWKGRVCLALTVNSTPPRSWEQEQFALYAVVVLYDATRKVYLALDVVDVVECYKACRLLQSLSDLFIERDLLAVLKLYKKQQAQRSKNSSRTVVAVEQPPMVTVQQRTVRRHTTNPKVVVHLAQNSTSSSSSNNNNKVDHSRLKRKGLKKSDFPPLPTASVSTSTSILHPQQQQQQHLLDQNQQMRVRSFRSPQEQQSQQHRKQQESSKANKKELYKRLSLESCALMVSPSNSNSTTSGRGTGTGLAADHLLGPPGALDLGEHFLNLEIPIVPVSPVFSGKEGIWGVDPKIDTPFVGTWEK